MRPLFSCEGLITGHYDTQLRSGRNPHIDVLTPDNLRRSCTSMTLPLNDPGSAVPAICLHTAIGMIPDSILYRLPSPAAS